VGIPNVEHVRSYPHIAEKIAQGTLRVHGWFFNIALAEVLAFADDEKRFMPIDADYEARFLEG